MSLRLVSALAAALLAFAAVKNANAAESFAGKTIRIIVGYNAAGGYGVYARLFGQFFSRYIPGNPNIVVQYMPSGGGVTLANYLANVADRDGLTIAMLPRSVAFQPLMGNPLAKFRAEDFIWLGTSSSYQNDAYSLLVRSDTPYKSLADLQAATSPVPFGADGAGGTNTDLLVIAKDVFNLNIHVVRGYKGPSEIGMAMARNEVVGRTFGMSSLQLFHSDWLNEGKLRFLVQFSRERWSKLPDVPTARELATDEDQRMLLALAETPLLLARPYVLPPGVPKHISAVLKKAFMDTHRDAEFLAINAKTKSEISPLDGDEVQQIVQQISRTPPALIERYKAALASK